VGINRILAERQLNIARGRGRLAREDTPVRDFLFPQGSRDRKLGLSRASAQDLIGGTIAKNKAIAADAVRSEQVGSIIQRITESAKRVGPALFDTLTFGKFNANPEIQKLTRTVLDAAGGKPLAVSVSEQKRQQSIVEGFLRQFAQRQFSQESENESEVSSQQGNAGKAKGQVSSTSSSGGSSTPSSSPPVTIDDLSGVQKSIEKLSSDLAQVSK